MNLVNFFDQWQYSELFIIMMCWILVILIGYKNVEKK